MYISYKTNHKVYSRIEMRKNFKKRSNTSFTVSGWIDFYYLLPGKDKAHARQFLK